MPRLRLFLAAAAELGLHAGPARWACTVGLAGVVSVRSHEPARDSIERAAPPGAALSTGRSR